MKFLTVLLTYIALTLATPDEHPLLNIFKRADACEGSCEDMYKRGKHCFTPYRTVDAECVCKLDNEFYKSYIDCGKNCDIIADALAESGIEFDYTPNEFRKAICDRVGIKVEISNTTNTETTSKNGAQMSGVSMLPLLAIVLL